MKRYAVALQVAGLIAVAVGAGLVAVPAGVIVAGIGLLAVGVLEETGR